MPNIKQQKKRVRTAAQERLENLRFRSTVKTLTERLESAVEDGDKERVAEPSTASCSAGSTRPSPTARSTATQALGRRRRPPASPVPPRSSQAVVAGCRARVTSAIARSSSSSDASRLAPLIAASSSARRTIAESSSSRE